MKNKVAIVIVTYNSEKDIEECINSIKHLANSNWQKVYIIDNASRDNTIKIIRYKFKNIEVIANEQNVGFAKAINQGVDKALNWGAEYIGLINPDAQFIKGDFSQLIQLFKVINNVGIVAPIIKDSNDNYGFTLGLTWNKAIGKAKHLRVTKLPNHAIAQTAVSGCCMLIKREVFDRLGKFDEHFFMYFEDIDFCLRARKLGYKIFLEPKTIIKHKLNSENINFRQTKTKYLMQSNIRLIKKHVQWYWWGIAFIYLGLLQIREKVIK